MHGGMMMRPETAVWALWGKTMRDGDEVQTHPLLCHLVDAAKVAGAIWDHSLADGMRRWIAESLATDEATCRRMVCTWAALHDIGKIAPVFQRKHASAIPGLAAAGLTFPRTFGRDTLYHGDISAWFLRREFARRELLPPAQASELAIALGGHHGSWRPFPARAPRREVGDDAWGSARSRITGILLALYGPQGRWHLPGDKAARRGLLGTLAGLVSVSDWIASMEEQFPAAPGTTELHDYAQRAGRQAGSAVRALGWARWQPPADPVEFRELFPFEPNAMQRTVVDLADELSGPALVIIEAPTGIGKTEAALYLADRWAHSHQQRGLYVAMPTMATSNQMHQRVRNTIERRYGGAGVEPLLIHGQALWQRLHRISSEDAGEKAHQDVDAMSWFLPRKRSLLAPFGVGTVDQALLSVLATRHFFVRMFGLAGKTVVFDEVHAYDTYMSQLFQRLLSWLHQQNASVVLLSATLPNATREELLRAWGAKPEASLDTTYPAVSTVSSGRVEQHALPRDDESSIAIEWVERDPAMLATLIKRELRLGGCAAIICNTVGRAQNVYKALRVADARDDDRLILFHARFPQAWRASTEKAVLEQFGKDGQRPMRAIVVATQVIEQSLDLDFDLMVSDLAPVDLLLQRAGRLHRHSRPEGRPESLRSPRLLLTQPDLADGLPDWGSDGWVYEPYILLRSYLALQGRDSLRLPGDTQPLIEAVYGDAALSEDPAFAQALDTAYQAMMQQRDKDRAEAIRRLVPSPDDELAMHIAGPDRDPDDPTVHRDLQALTRLGPPNITIVCLHARQGSVYTEPDGGCPAQLDEEPSDKVARELALHAVSVSHPRLYAHFCSQPAPTGWRKHPYLRHCRAAVFDNGLCTCEGTDYRMSLGRELGLVIEKEQA